LYINGIEEDTTVHGAKIDFGTDIISVGYWGTHRLNGFIDDFAVFDRAVPVDEIRAIYESNAPIFGETSTFHWRAGRNRVWADAEGLWMLNASGTAVLGAYAGDEDNPSATKSWGGIALEESDVLIGDSNRGGYVRWDDSTAVVEVKGTIIMQSGSTGIANFGDAGYLATIDDLDGVPNGAIYGRARKVALSANGLVLMDQVLDGDGLGGGTYGRIQKTSVTASGVVIMDQIAEGDGAGGGTYGLVNQTAITAGNILLSATIGDLDDIDEGGTYGKIRQTILGAGFIQVGNGTKDTDLDGWKIDNTEIVGQLDGADQVVLDTNGRILAGGGNVVLDTSGINIDYPSNASASHVPPESGRLTFWDDPVSRSNLGLDMYSYHQTSATARQRSLIKAHPGSTDEAQLTLRAIHGAEAYLDLFAIVPSGGVATEGHAVLWADDTIGLYTGALERLHVGAGGNVGIGTTTATNSLLVVEGGIAIKDGITAPSTSSGYAQIYVDSADGDLKIRFGNGTTKTIVTDT
jgi:hypothetical protein